MKRAQAILSVSVLAVGTALTATAQSAVAAGPVAVTACGTTITTDAYLAQNLTCPGGIGVTLAAAVTFDLRGHTLAGPGRAAATFATSTAIVVHHSNVSLTRITNGTVTGWAFGIGALSSLPVVFDQAERIDHLVISDGGPHSVGGVGIDPVLNADLTVDHVSISGMARGINVTVANGDISDTQLSDGDEGIEVFQGLLVLNRSSISHFTTGVLCGEASLTCTYIRSTFTSNITALDMQGARDILSHDILEHNGIGVSAAFLSEADVSDSLFGHNNSGIRVEGEGIAKVQNSSFEYNVVGIRVPISIDEFPATTDLRSNIFRHNRDGLLVTNIRNTSTLHGNNAYLNTGWGLYAAGIVHDLGGNRAHGNGFAAQCFHVACTA